jgi:hypothetical protein
MSGGSLTAIGIALALGFLVAMLSVPGCQRSSAIVVNFPDPGLEAAIRAAIGKPTGDIHDTDLIGLTSLNAGAYGIVNLEGMQHCVDLTEILLEGNEIVDIQPLVDNAGLGAEDEVYISYNNLYLTPVSLDMLNIEALERRGVRVYFDPQN